MDTSNPSLEATIRYVRGSNPQDVVDGMIADGFDPEASVAAVNAVHARRATESGSAGARDLIMGLVICAIGSAITFFTYQAASGGGTYTVAWGAIIFGGVQAARGAYTMFGRG